MGLMKYATPSGLVYFVGLHLHRALPCAIILFPWRGNDIVNDCVITIIIS